MVLLKMRMLSWTKEENIKKLGWHTKSINLFFLACCQLNNYEGINSHFSLFVREVALFFSYLYLLFLFFLVLFFNIYLILNLSL